MFPTLSDLIYYLTGVRLSLPVQTFGFFMVVAFGAAYVVFQSEYKRKEAGGIIHPRPPKIVRSDRFPMRPLLIGALAGFVAGAKIGYILSNRSMYLGSPAAVIFSFAGSLAAGLVTGAITVLILWISYRRTMNMLPGVRREAKRASPGIGSPGSSGFETGEAAPVSEEVHPYQMMDQLLLYCGLSGFAGALLFAKLENTAGLLRDPSGWLYTFDGLNYYGALIFGALTYLYINRRRGIPLAVAADIGSPGMMLAYGIGRIGCHLAGDGDWGIVNQTPVPGWLSWAPSWIWSSRYPHNSIHQGIFLPGCTDNYCTELAAPVYPTSLYEAVICILLFILLWMTRRRLGQAGLLFSLYALLNGTERFLIEFIRINPKYSIMGWNISQSQIIALLWMGIGLAGVFSLTGTFSLPKRDSKRLS